MSLFGLIAVAFFMGLLLGIVAATCFLIDLKERAGTKMRDPLLLEILADE
ncbi:hypothetical protein [Sphingobium phenoxybenzoativorans]|nr:hypothetical protein [Sphingobium phenoxybenzoativorans]